MEVYGYKSPDCPVVHQTVRWCTGLSGESSVMNSSVSGNEKGDVAKIHRTVRWFTGLSGEPTAPAPTVFRAISARHVARSNGRLGAPDCPVCTGLSGVHRTVSGVPTSPEEQRSDAPDMEGDRAPDMNSGCPVVHRTVRCSTRQKARIAFQVGIQRLLAALGL
jgi:hypothetical protein